MTDTPEFSRLVDSRQLPRGPVELAAEPAERAALAARFDLAGIDSLVARVALAPQEGGIALSGTLEAAYSQYCRVSGEPFAQSLKTPVDLLFVPAERFAALEAASASEDEDSADDDTAGHRLDPEQCDLVPYSGSSLDLGEAIAQSFALAIDPWAEGPDAEAFRAAHDLSDRPADGPFAALKALKRDG